MTIHGKARRCVREKTEDDVNRSEVQPLEISSRQEIDKIQVRRKTRLMEIAEDVETARDKGSLPSGVNHEIGKAVNSLLVTLGLLKAKLEALDKPSVEGYIDRSLNHVSRMAYLLRSLKNGSIFNTPELRYIKVADFIGEFVGLLNEDYTAKGIEIKTSIRTDVEYCYADPRSLYHILVNLLMNASDALEGREHPEISIIAYNVGSTAVRLRVKDNGCGMTEDQLRDLYKPFYTTKAHGSGLGLIIVNRLLTSMNGSMEIESKRDVGTAVNLTLPAGLGTEAHDPLRIAS
jgi:C4-dicarboxylate-specific signal transduction histidine kinase